MGHYRNTFRIAAPVEQLWELMSDPARLPEWNGAFDRVEDATGRLDEVGTTYTQVMRVAGVELKGRWEIIEVEPSQTRRFRGTPPGCTAWNGTETFAAADGGVDYTVEMDYRLKGGPIGAALDRVLAKPFLARMVERNIESLRTTLEAPR